MIDMAMVIKDADLSNVIKRYIDGNVLNEFMQMHDCYLDRDLTYDAMDVLCSIMRSEKNEA